MQPTTLDFETKAIVGNPLLDPPEPVGLAVRWVDGTSEYYTGDSMQPAWEIAMGTRGGKLFHNAYFDLSVARKWFGTPFPDWNQVHDTMYLLYLKDPYARSYSLKPNAEKYLDLPPEEQDLCKEWVLANVREARESNWGAFLWLVPEELLAPYAIGDVERTYGLFEKLYLDVPQEAYDRERRLAPILVEATRRGVRLATGPLEEAHGVARAAFEQVDQRLATTLHTPGLNPGSPQQLVEALDRAGVVEHWGYTDKGNKSCDMKKLRLKDDNIFNLLKYRSTLKTMLSTFIEPWLENHRNGRLHPNWNSTRGDRDGGTRTGRLSSSGPNFQNIPNPTELVTPDGLPDLPHLRNYILPEEGHLWLKRDFSAQEIRVMAHFEDGALAEAFRQNPALDPHELVRAEILRLTGKDYPRKYVKETGFGILYGMGVATLAARLGVHTHIARDLMDAYKVAIPGVGKLQKGTKNRGYADLPIRTWGGREIYKEPARVVKGALRSFEYKLLNYLIQGSSADQTKECIIHWEGIRGDAVFMATVHDENNVSAPEDNWKEHMERLRYSMEEVCNFDVPMLTEGFAGPSWGEVRDE